MSVVVLSGLLLGTSCSGYWHDIAVPVGARESDGGAPLRLQVIGVAERVSLAHGLRSIPVPSPRCTPHWGAGSTDTSGWAQKPGWPDVCVDTTQRGEVVVSLDDGVRELRPGSRADSIWRALRDSLAPLGGVPRRKP